MFRVWLETSDEGGDSRRRTMAAPGPHWQVRNPVSLKIPTRQTQNFWSSASHLACRRVPAEPVFQPACRHARVHTETHVHTHPARPIFPYRILFRGPHLRAEPWRSQPSSAGVRGKQSGRAPGGAPWPSLSTSIKWVF